MASKQEMLLSVLAVKQGLITPERVQECMDLQRIMQEEKQDSVSLLKIFLAKEYLSVEQIRDMQTPALPKTVTIEGAKQLPDYEIIEQIGEGGVATVFKAIHKPTDNLCALKILFPIHAINSIFVERFRNEAELLVKFDHKNLVKGFEYGVYPPDDVEVEPHERLHYLAMELVTGRSVQDDILENSSLDENKALHIIIQIAETLEYLHFQNVVHRDIKPDNILYDDEGNIKLCDLGFAKEIETDKAGSIEDVTCGTVQYISPEQARGYIDVDIRADIYSLGATLFHLVTGDVPFTGKDSMDIMAKQVLENIDQEKFQKLTPYFGYFIEKMMAKDRENRYQTPRECIEDINSIISGAQSLQYKPEHDPLLAKLVAPLKKPKIGTPKHFKPHRGIKPKTPPIRKATPLMKTPKPIRKPVKSPPIMKPKKNKNNINPRTEKPDN
ncbi:MAG: serine/threonine protein kinase [Planctomycetes bacterium]|nr:serine/threonine protein kinase [Planctomycetota bacterium]